MFVIISRSAEGYEFRGFVPSCFDPTYCETNPPIPFYENANYKIPPIGTLKFNDGEVVTYTCQNSSIFLVVSILFWWFLFTYIFIGFYFPLLYIKYPILPSLDLQLLGCKSSDLWFSLLLLMLGVFNLYPLVCHVKVKAHLKIKN